MTTKDLAGNLGTVNLRMNVAGLTPLIKQAKSKDPYTRSRAIGKLSIELSIGIGRSIGVFVPEVGVVFETIKLLKDLVEAFSAEPETFGDDEKREAAIDGGFKKNDLLKAKSDLKDLNRDINRYVQFSMKHMPPIDSSTMKADSDLPLFQDDIVPFEQFKYRDTVEEERITQIRKIFGRYGCVSTCCVFKMN